MAASRTADTCQTSETSYTCTRRADRAQREWERKWEIAPGGGTKRGESSCFRRVAGATGVLLCDLWAWARGEQLHRSAAIQFGRGLQAVNILRNRAEDLARGVDFFPTGWTREQMHQYARRQLMQAEAYSLTMPPAPFEALIHIPLVLAKATLDALVRGETKLSRSEVLSIVGQIQTQEPTKSDLSARDNLL